MVLTVVMGGSTRQTQQVAPGPKKKPEGKLMKSDTSLRVGIPSLLQLHQAVNKTQKHFWEKLRKT